MERKYIDINCDVGEGMGNEAMLFPYISSCNIACGGHAGDEKSMLEVSALARKHRIKVGGHPSYPDKANFGRIPMNLEKKQLLNSIRTQLSDLEDVLKKNQINMHHIKPHGALYNDLARDKQLALDFLEAVAAYRETCWLYAPYNSVLAALAREGGFRVKQEAFGDRAYTNSYQLVSRNEEGALIEDPEAVLRHVLRMVLEGEVVTIEGERLPLEADTYCIHGDTPTALQILTYLGRELPRYGIYLKE